MELELLQKEFNLLGEREIILSYFDAKNKIEKTEKGKILGIERKNIIFKSNKSLKLIWVGNIREITEDETDVY